MTTRTDYQRLFDLWRAHRAWPAASTPTCKQQLRERGFGPRAEEDRRDEQAGALGLQEEPQGRGRRAPPPQEGRRGRRTASRTSSTSARASSGNDESDIDSLGPAQRRGARRRERAAADSTRRPSSPRPWGLTLAGAALARLPQRGGDPDPLPALHHPQARRDAARHLGPRCPSSRPAQRWILRNVGGAPPGPRPPATASSRIDSIATNAAVHVGAKVVLKVDLKDFFPTVTFRRARGHLPPGGG